MNDLLLYFHTLRYLKPVQIYGRLWFRLRRPTPDLQPAPALRPAAGGGLDIRIAIIVLG